VAVTRISGFLFVTEADDDRPAVINCQLFIHHAHPRPPLILIV